MKISHLFFSKYLEMYLGDLVHFLKNQIPIEQFIIMYYFSKEITPTKNK